MPLSALHQDLKLAYLFICLHSYGFLSLRECSSLQGQRLKVSSLSTTVLDMIHHRQLENNYLLRKPQKARGVPTYQNLNHLSHLGKNNQESLLQLLFPPELLTWLCNTSDTLPEQGETDSRQAGAITKQ